MTRRVVWILNHYAAEEARDGRTSRHEQFARRLGQHGWHCVLIGASTVHPSGAQTFRGLRLREHRHVGTHEVLRVRGVRYRGPGGRLLDIALVVVLLLVPGFLRGLPRPDVIVGSSFHPLMPWVAARLARRLGVRFVFEPRDLWPETLVDLAGRPECSLPVRILRAVERDIVRRADAVVSPLAGVGGYYASRGSAVPFTWISNGTAGEDDGTGDCGTQPTEGPDVAAKRGPSDEFVVTYLGSVGRANALDTVVDAVSHPTIESLGCRVVLRIVGDGPALDDLRRRAATGPAAGRIEFLGRRPQQEARAIGRASDCLVANMRDIPLYRWGVSFNKLFEYARIRRPVVLGAAGPVPVFDAGNAVITPADDPAALAAGIARVAAMRPDEREALASSAWERTQRSYTYPILTARFAVALGNVLDGCPSGPVPTPATPEENPT